jgi:uncharacterized protein YqgC (DUF456 family)
MSTLLVVIGGICAVTGIVGCVVPVLPGPPISYISLILLSWAKGWKVYSLTFLLVMGIVTVAVTVLDYLLPVYLPKRYGASKFGIYGSILGMIVGMLIFPPFGFIIGTFIGAVVGELLFNKDKRVTLKAALGVFIGTVAAFVLKLIVSGLIGFYFFNTVVGGVLR